MVHYKLTYFDVRGRGEMIRMILHYAGEKFEDNRITSFEQWGELKPMMPFGQMPILEVDGVKIPQSCAIARFLAKRYGLAGKDDVESAMVDAVGDQLKDFLNEYKEYHMNFFALPHFDINTDYKESDKERLHKELFLPALEKHLPLFEKVLAESKSGYFAKSGLTWVDFAMANQLLTLENIEKGALDNYPLLKKLLANVHALPQLKAYLAKRKETVF